MHILLVGVSLHDAYCKKSKTMPDFVAVKELVGRLLQMLRSFLGPSVVHSTSPAAVASSSWQNVSNPRPMTRGGVAILL